MAQRCALEVQMPRHIHACVAAVLLVLAAGTAGAQEVRRHRGFETGLDVYSSERTGEVAFYAGGFEGNSMLAIRFSGRDETDSIPCSVGAMYEFVGFRHAATRVKPMAGASFNRIFSCASDSDVIARPSPSLQSAATVSGGVRVPIFTGGGIGGSLKLAGYVERARGHVSSADTTSKGFVVGVVFHGR